MAGSGTGRARLRARHGVAVTALGAFALTLGLVQTTSSTAGGGSQPCPSGTTLVARFDHSGGRYVFVQPSGNAGVVTITGGTARGGSWSSQVPIAATVVTGGGASVVTSLAPPQPSGSFGNDGLPPDESGYTPRISKLQLCGPPVEPTTTTVEATTTTGYEETTTTGYEETTTTGYEETTTTGYEATTTTGYEATTTTGYETTTTVAPTTTTTVAPTTTTTVVPTTVAHPTTTTAAPTTTTTAGPTTTAEATTTAGPTTTAEATTTVSTATVDDPSVVTDPSSVLVASSTTVVPDEPDASPGALAFTGGPSSVLVTVGVSLLGAGLALTTVASRRERRSRT